MTIQTTLGS